MHWLLDIEGTTTSISFVYDVLFPFARRELSGFLERDWGSEAMAADIAALRAQADQDRAAGIDVPPMAGPDASHLEIRKSVELYVLAQMDTDRKTTALKSLQGRIWRDGYSTGTLCGHVYPDVPSALHRWSERNDTTFIYSSGSIAAQRLLFGASVAGDLRPLIAGHFDTTTGPKREAASYAAIADAIGADVGDVTFVTDNLLEAAASREAGMYVVISVRPGNAELPEHDFPVVRSFDELG